ncbi:hypothetical protein SAMN05421831_10517 [Allopseudospirillum japonicum]|uniref:SSD domain-containing protein n=1 Tax=Allopseudospirillum japonicum TaxID=64971 RepID=A0A1H6RUL2_9GAMM|nr:MMPL family transporter [Allopseudospirillum japonicum]SEI59419.1 hypothetical protein SAMN05421831_10517 [Allopseudospirillum japonicum]
MHLSDSISASESWFENILFKHRPFWLFILTFISLMLAAQAIQIRPQASFEKLIPLQHPYIENLMQHKDDLQGLGNSLRIVLSIKDQNKDIFDADYLEHLRQLQDEIIFLAATDPAQVKSLWSPSVRWTEVTEEGFAGGSLIPNTYDASLASLQQVRENILKSGQVGILVANDFRSALIQAPLLPVELDYQALGEQLELLRDKYSNQTYQVHIIGFAKLVGDLIEGATQVGTFFIVAFIITGLLLYAYSRCIRSALIPLFCSFVAVIWQLGLLHLLGFGLDPYSMLVPFLVFAIGVSHGVQMVNAMVIEASHGASTLQAARQAFRSLYLAGMLALISDAIGFMTLFFIEIQVIKELALAASLGVAIIIISNLIMLPLIMSYAGIGKKSCLHAQRQRQIHSPTWQLLAQASHAKIAPISLALALLIGIMGLYGSSFLKIGDLDKGAPELRPHSVYNLDNAYITDKYATSADIMVVMVKSAPQACVTYPVLAGIEALQAAMQNVPSVQSSVSPVNIAKRVISGFNEGNLKWQALSSNQFILNNAMSQLPTGMMNNQCDLLPVILYLQDHKAQTLTQVTQAVEAFANQYPSDEVEFLLAAGSAGIEAATNAEIEHAQSFMLIFVYIVVSLLVWFSFRDWRAVICIILPLGLTSVLCQALMAALGIGVKVATLPVIALGVGIGVDYGIYIYARLIQYQKEGESLTQAYYHTLRSTGKAVSFTGFTLALGVFTWIFSPIKFQADMGILLTFMFLWNMLGALWLLPAFAHYLLTDKIQGSTH